MNLKKVLFILCLACLLGCGEKYDNDHPIGYDAIVGNHVDSQLKQIVFTLDLQYSDSLYLVTDSVYNLEIFLNNQFWGSFQSTTIDTSAFQTKKLDHSLFSSVPVEYLFVTVDQADQDTLSTAGDYARALKELLSIPAGDYVAELRSVSWTATDGTIISRPIRDVIPFKLSGDTRSLYLGSFSVDIKL